jgi:hypothetical protein
MNSQEKLLQMNDKGFLKSKIDIDNNFEDLIHFVKNNYEKFSNDRESKGYSNDIYKYLPSNLKDYLKKFSLEILTKNSWIKNYIFLPRLLSIQVLNTSFNLKTFNNPTHAMLWHRDADDLYHHIKVQVPLGKISKQNGIFSCADRKICSINHKLVDKELYNNSINSNDEYRASDKIRISDKKMYKYFKDQIYDFESNISDILFIDTNYCYHRGGLIIDQSKTRNLLTITYGGVTHQWNKYFQNPKENHSFTKLFARSLKFYKKISLKLNGGVREIPIILK